MPTVNKTWGFAFDAQGLTDQGLTSAISFGWDADQAEEPDQESGCVRWTGVGNNQTERARRSSTGETWQTWGVPSGKVVTGIRISEWWKRVVNDDELVASARIRMRVVDSDGNSVTASDLISASPLGSGTWQQQSAGSQETVLSGKESSGTDVRLELEFYGAVTNDNGTPFDIRLDQIVLEITYQDAVAPVSGSDSGAGADQASLSTSIPTAEAGVGQEATAAAVQIAAGDSASGAEEAAAIPPIQEVSPDPLILMLSVLPAGTSVSHFVLELEIGILDVEVLEQLVTPAVLQLTPLLFMAAVVTDAQYVTPEVLVL